jgi:hypothetical protein
MTTLRACNIAGIVIARRLRKLIHYLFNDVSADPSVYYLRFVCWVVTDSNEVSIGSLYVGSLLTVANSVNRQSVCWVVTDSSEVSIGSLYDARFVYLYLVPTNQLDTTKHTDTPFSVTPVTNHQSPITNNVFLIVVLFTTNVAEGGGAGRPYMKIWRIVSACWVTKATDTHTELALITALTLQQLGKASPCDALRTAHISCLSTLPTS